HHHAPRLPGPRHLEPHVQRGIVRERSADPDDDGVALTPEAVSLRARLHARDPTRRPVLRGDLAVERHRRLERDMRPPQAHGGEEAAVLGAHLGASRADRHLDAARAQGLGASARHVGIGIHRARHYPRHSGVPDGPCAGRRPAVVVARLERDVEGGAARALARRRQRHDLGMGAARLGVKALAHDLAVADHHRAHHRIRRGQPAAPLRERERALHERQVLQGVGGHESGSKAEANAFASKGWRSSIFSPTPTSLMGTPSSRQIRTTMPPLAVPSSLVRTSPVRPTASWKSLACAIPFWPVGASITIRLSWGAPGSWRSITRLSLTSSSMRLVLVCSRPAVSTKSTSAPRAVAALTASKTTAA